MPFVPDDPGSPGGALEAALPEWIDELEAALWVVDAEGTLRHVNERARDLLAIDATSIGSPCHEVIGGRSEDLGPLCEEHCRMRRAMAQGHPVPPVLMRRAAGESEQVLLVVPIPLADEAPANAWLVHIAVDATLAWRSVAFLQSVSGSRKRVIPARSQPLTEREREVLTRLAEGEGIKRIAYQLGRKPTTVRNHVQHILAKLGASSMLEAIALFVLRGTSREGSKDEERGFR